MSEFDERNQLGRHSGWSKRLRGAVFDLPAHNAIGAVVAALHETAVVSPIILTQLIEIWQQMRLLDVLEGNTNREGAPDELIFLLHKAATQLTPHKALSALISALVEAGEAPQSIIDELIELWKRTRKIAEIEAKEGKSA